MVTLDKNPVCYTCGKGNGRVRCEGCSKLFCLNDFNGHRQELGSQLDEIETTRDLFRQALTEAVAEPQSHALIQKIDRWESESIKKIRLEAKEAKQRLSQAYD